MFAFGPSNTITRRVASHVSEKTAGLCMIGLVGPHNALFRLFSTAPSPPSTSSQLEGMRRGISGRASTPSGMAIRTTAPLHWRDSRFERLLREAEALEASKAADEDEARREVTVNDRTYLLPTVNRPVVAICLDGTSQEYVNAAVKAGCMPNWERILGNIEKDDVDFSERETYALSHGTQALVTSAYPTFTNPNNVGIMTGVSPRQHGICGNYYFDEATGQEVTMTSTDLLRADSIFAALVRKGVRVTVVTTKDKLKRLLSAQMPLTPAGSDIVLSQTSKHDTASPGDSQNRHEKDQLTLTNADVFRIDRADEGSEHTNGIVRKLIQRRFGGSASGLSSSFGRGMVGGGLHEAAMNALDSNASSSSSPSPASSGVTFLAARCVSVEALHSAMTSDDVETMRRGLPFSRLVDVSNNQRGFSGCNSSTPSSSTTVAVPHIYDEDASIYALDLGLALVERDLRAARKEGLLPSEHLFAEETNASPSVSDAESTGGKEGVETETLITSSSAMPSLYYISTTDYVQHKHAPGSEAANAFMNKVDRVIGRLHDIGAIVGITADHGMNEKTNYDGTPRVVYLSDILTSASISARVILPISDPYLAHHGALGGYATVYLEDKSKLQDTMALLRQTPGIYTVMGKHDAAKALDLPVDRIGDFVVLGDQHTVLGKSKEFHDLSQLAGVRLRSHGGLDEATVPVFVNRCVDIERRRQLSRGTMRNWDLLDLVLNGIPEESHKAAEETIKKANL